EIVPDTIFRSGFSREPGRSAPSGAASERSGAAECIRRFDENGKNSQPWADQSCLVPCGWGVQAEYVRMPLRQMTVEISALIRLVRFEMIPSKCPRTRAFLLVAQSNARRVVWVITSSWFASKTTKHSRRFP